MMMEVHMKNTDAETYKKYLENEPWYGDLLTLLVAGVCHTRNEYYPYIMDALERLGKLSKAICGETDEYTYIYGEPVKDNPEEDYEYPFAPPKPDAPRSKGDMRVAEEILRQLGGREFVTMTGCKNLVADGNTLRMCLMENRSGANRLFITYHHYPDAYTMRFFYYRAASYRGVPELGKVVETPEVITEIETFEDVYCDRLRTLFEQVTGLDTHMPKIMTNQKETIQ
jgi:hypothetical protein